MSAEWAVDALVTTAEFDYKMLFTADPFLTNVRFPLVAFKVCKFRLALKMETIFFALSSLHYTRLTMWEVPSSMSVQRPLLMHVVFANNYIDGVRAVESIWWECVCVTGNITDSWYLLGECAFHKQAEHVLRSLQATDPGILVSIYDSSGNPYPATYKVPGTLIALRLCMTFC